MNGAPAGAASGAASVADAARATGAATPPQRRALLTIAVVGLVLPVLRPPEVSPLAAIAVEILAAAVFVPATRRRALLPADARGAALLLLPLAAAAVFLASNAARAVDEAAMISQFIVFLVLGASVAQEPALRRLLPVLLVALGTAASIQAIAQHHWAWPRAAAELRALGAPSDAASDAMLVRLESGRPSGPFVLPTALAGFLATTLAATVLVAGRARGASRVAAIAALLVQGDAFLMTRSLGGLGALGCALAVLFLPGVSRRGGRILAAAGAVVVLVGVVSFVFLRLRQAEMTSSPGADPWTLRSGNWRAAAAMVRDHPLFGVGPGAFGIFYPRYMRPGMNETRYAHDSYLQMAATWGIWILLPIGAGIAAFVARAWHSDPGDPGRRVALAGGAAFLAHNLVDFTFYQPGVALPCALLIGFGAARDDGAAADTPPASPRPDRPRLALAGAAALLLAGHAVIAGRCTFLLDRAEVAARRGHLADAQEIVREAARARPGDPQPWAFLSEIVIANRRDDPVSLRTGRSAAERAAALDPESAMRHHVLALYHAADREPAAAWLEERRAHDLFPSKPLYDDAAGAEPAR